MNIVQVVFAALGRMCLSLIFILSGLNKIWDWQGAKQGIYNGLCDLMTFTQNNELMQKILEHALPWVSLLLILGIVFELVGGLLIFLSLNIRLGAFLLLIFLILTTLFFHHFWYLQGTDYDLQLSMFLKNLSIFGGLLIVLTYGKGKNKTVKNSEKKTEKNHA